MAVCQKFKSVLLLRDAEVKCWSGNIPQIRALHGCPPQTLFGRNTPFGSLWLTLTDWWPCVPRVTVIIRSHCLEMASEQIWPLWSQEVITWPERNTIKILSPANDVSAPEWIELNEWAAGCLFCDNYHNSDNARIINNNYGQQPP